MRVEILESKLRAKGVTYEQGDRTTVDDETGARWCALGWAKDLAGEVETGERKPGAVRLDIHAGKHRRGGV